MFAKRCGSLVFILALGVGLTFWPTGADAQKKGKEPAAEEKGEVTNDLVTAYNLAEFGRKNEAPEALITAGSLLRRLSKMQMGKITEKATIEVEKGSSEQPLDKEVKTPDLADEADAMFDEAQALGSKLGLNVDKLIKAAKARPNTRGVFGGPRSITRVVAAKQTLVYHFDFEPLRPMAIGFRSTIPIRVTVTRSDIDNPWTAAISTGGIHRGVPGRSRTGRVPTTVRITNPNLAPAQFTLFVE